MPLAVLFDLYNTLVDGGDADRDATTAAMAKDIGADPVRFTTLFHETWPERRTGALGDVEATVRALAARAGCEPTAAAVRLASARRVALTRRLLWPSASTLAALDDLRRAGWRLGLVSNCTVETATQWRNTPLAARFEATAFSCELGVAKPDRAIYLAACSALSAAPVDCVYVGDGADDELVGAADLGMTVIRTEEFRPARGTWPRERVGSLAELVRILSGPREKNPRSAVAG